MGDHESWENKCCRCEGTAQQNLRPGKRACHVTCGPCLYPEDWGKCVSCEIVSHCAYALDHLRTVQIIGMGKGCTFDQQLTGEESVYHTLNFVNGQQNIIKSTGEKTYIENLKKLNAKSPCLKKHELEEAKRNSE